MKKKSLLALLLALVMCISLCACGGGGSSAPSPEEQIVGTWEGTFDTGHATLTIESDYTGTFNDVDETYDINDTYELTWEYNEETELFKIVVAGRIAQTAIENTDGVETMTFDLGGGTITYTKQATE